MEMSATHSVFIFTAPILAPLYKAKIRDMISVMVRDKKTVRYPLVRDNTCIFPDCLKDIFYNSRNLLLEHDYKSDENYDHLW